VIPDLEKLHNDPRDGTVSALHKYCLLFAAIDYGITQTIKNLRRCSSRARQSYGDFKTNRLWNLDDSAFFDQSVLSE
jgi:hypothetical protein